MPSLTIPLLPDGALVTIVVAISAPRQAALLSLGQKPPAPVSGNKGLIDTGASGTVIDSSLIRALQLTPTGSVATHTPTTGNTPVFLNQYDVALGIAMDQQKLHVSHWTIPVIESDLAAQGIDALIGRDVLSLGLLVYDGKAARVTLAF